MKTEPRKSFYPLPADFGRMEAAYIDDRRECGLYYRLTVMAVAELTRILFEPGGGPFGLPTCIAFSPTELILWPTPDKAYNVVIRYTPPEKEF